jgi:hypothetical protein
MSRRIFSISLVLVFLLIAFMWVTMTGARAQGSTPTPMPTSPAEFIGAPLTGSAPLTVQYTHIGGNGPVIYCVWTFGDGTSQTFAGQTANPFSACPSVSHIYRDSGKYTVALNALTNNGNPTGSKVNFDYVQVAGPTPTATPSTPSVPDLVVQSLVYTNSNPPCPNTPRIQVSVGNNGSAVTAPFQVSFNGETRTVNGLDFHQGAIMDFSATGGTKTAMIDSTNVIVESNESNNSLVFVLPALIPCGGPSLTPTTGASPTRTNTPTVSGPTPTLTRTPTVSGPTSTQTRTPTPVTGATCTPVTSTITIPFTFDGAGTFCWQASSLGGFINSWNTTSVSVNGMNVTNIWVGSGSYPAKINNNYYVSYNSTSAFGHFEAKP